jgi:riboflavin synthase
MFTGLVQKLGRIAHVEPDGHGGQNLRIHEPELAPTLVLGESISVNGVCLTVISQTAQEFAFQAGPETLNKTNLGLLKVGDPVNLERALRVGDALGGHFVTGHIDTVGKIREQIPSGEWQTYWFDIPEEFDSLIVQKGSIAIDGVSLTVVDAEPSRISVMLIPHTLANTTLGSKHVGDVVNLEFDLLAKHVQKLLKNITITL